MTAVSSKHYFCNISVYLLKFLFIPHLIFQQMAIIQLEDIAWPMSTAGSSAL